MSYGVLLCCAEMGNGHKLCILRGLQMGLSLEGDPVKNETDCPLLTDTVFTVKSSAVLKGVSILHECGSYCMFLIQTCSTIVERLSRKLHFQHDWCGNDLYHLNIYCII